MGFCNTVLEPYLAALAGLGFMLIYSAEDDRVVAVDFNTRAPKDATPDMYRVVGESAAGGTKIFEVEGNENSIGAKAITVPATLVGFCRAHELYGSKSLSDVLAPAIALASDGFSLGWDQALILATMMRDGGRNPEVDDIWYPGGYPPAPNTVIRQPALGRLLKRVALEGSSFVYNGDVGKAIVEAVQEGGGILSEEDLASFQPIVSEPQKIRYRDLDIATVPTPSGGVTVLEALNVLERFDLASMGHNSAEYLHVMTEASRHAFADRYSLLGDWVGSDVPLEGILSKGHASKLASGIDLDGASFPKEGAEPWVRYLGRPLHKPASSAAGVGGDTTHFNAVDCDGNAVCCTHTPGFQSGIVPRGTGLYLTAAMGWFVPKAGYPNSVAGWKRPLMNMAPLMVLKEGRPVILEGAPGSRRIIARNTQVVLNIVEFGMGPQDAVAAPTIDTSGIDTLVDSRIAPKVVERLRAKGHRIKLVEEAPGMSFFARPSAVLIDREKGVLRAGVDVFRRSTALGL
jgi:gamma-glutamyltranspeptidase/glutathione hydrolase